MQISEIITKVRLRIDEESQNEAAISAMAGDNTRMDNIITSLADDALHWLYLNAPTNLLVSDGNDNSISEVTSQALTNGLYTLPNGFLRLVRVKGRTWHRAISTPISEDSEEYLQLNNTDGATATTDRPQAVLIERKNKKLEVWPKNAAEIYEITCIVTPTISNGAYPIPTTLESSYIYYIAFLLLSAYGDARAKTMLEIAKLNLGGAE